MRKSMIVMGFLLALCLVQGTAKSNPRAELKVVTAGDPVTFKVELGQTPQFSGGRLSVLVGPINIDNPDEITGAQFTRVSDTETIANQATYEVSVRIPGDAPNGVWQAFFSFALPNGGPSPLRHARQIFRVKKQTYSGVPENATVGLQ